MNYRSTFQCHLCNAWYADERAKRDHEKYHDEKLGLGPHNEPLPSEAQMDDMADDLADLLTELAPHNSPG